VRRTAARSQCANNLRQIGIALHCYADTTPGRPAAERELLPLPAGTVPNASLPPERRLSWVVDVLPYLEQDALYRRIDRTAAWDDEPNLDAVRTPVRLLACPDLGSESRPGADYLATYVGVAGVGADAALLPADHPAAGVCGYDRRTGLRAIKDGSSNTLLLLETARGNLPWAQGGPATVRGLDPADQPYLGKGRPFGGLHFAENSLLGRGKSLGCNAVMADGSVHFLADTLPPRTLEALATVAGGEEIEGGW
jgi:hypothetical protein